MNTLWQLFAAFARIGALTFGSDTRQATGKRLYIDNTKSFNLTSQHKCVCV